MTKIGAYLNIAEARKIIFSGLSVNIHDKQQALVKDSFEFLQEHKKDKIIYGINTGFGPMAQQLITEEEQLKLQYNLIRSHSSGSGKLMEPQMVRALMLARVNSLVKGYSGVSLQTIEIIQSFLNNGIYPLVFEHGGVGASGDLVQLAHLALCLIGEGEVFYQGQRQATAGVLQKLNIEPLKISIREGLALLNGTSAMTGIGIINCTEANNLFNWVLLLSALMIETTNAFDDFYSTPLNEVKLHAGQMHVATALQELLLNSSRTRKRESFAFDYREKENRFTEKVQEYYSIRCLPQILGPIYDTIKSAEKIIEQELNSVNDNPVIDAKRKEIFHGGNFHGDYVALEMDKLKIAITKLSMLAERQLNYLLNDQLNAQLPPFVNRGKLGLNLGMQGAQFTATSTTAENQSLCTPLYVHSIPCNRDNQDVVSMGTNAALFANKVIMNTYEILAIQSLTVLQAIDCLGIKDELNPLLKGYYDELRGLVPSFKEDIVMYEALALVRMHLQQNQPLIKNDLTKELYA